MLETLQNVDQALFLFINVKLANPVTDLVMPLVTSDNLLRVLYAVAIVLLLLWKCDWKLRWMVLALVLVLKLTDLIMPLVTSGNMPLVLYGAPIVLLLWKGDRKLRWMVLASALALLLTDQISAGLLKPMIGRLRPCHELIDINLLVNCGGGKAMPSSHAANVLGQAVLFSFHYRKVSPYLYSFAALVAVSRVFVGVHYVGDIVAGAILGMAIGLAVAVAYRWWHRKTGGPEKVTTG
jgi:undecaprenyl-diphosphatase